MSTTSILQRLLLLFGLIAYTTSINAQSTCTIPSTLEFTQQSQIDNFALSYPNCTEVQTLVISGNNITNLHGLSNLTQVDILSVNRTALSSLEGLQNLKIAKTINISENGILPIINLNLERTTILNISSNPILERLEFNQLSQVLSNIAIINNQQLLNLGDFSALEYIPIIKIISNSNLKSLDGLDDLQLLAFGLEIIDNPSLNDISALGNARFNVEQPYFRVYNNPSLSNCAINSFCEDVINYPNNENSIIRDNATGCNTKTEVQASCTTNTSENLEILSYTCPPQYPEPNGELTYQITVRNNGSSASSPTPLYRLSSIGGGRYAPYQFTKQGETIVPAIAAGQSLTFEATFIQSFTPRFIGDIAYGDLSTQAYTFSFEERPDGFAPFEDGYVEVDLFCKKAEGDLRAEIITDNSTYVEEGIINYTILVINENDTPAHNVRVRYAVGGNLGMDLVSFEADKNENTYTTTYRSTGSILYDWTTPRIEAKDTVTIQVQGRINYSAGTEFVLRGSVFSPHIIDTNPDDNSPSLRFTELQQEAALEIISNTCPIQFPQPKGDLNFDITIRNNGTIASTLQPLSLYRRQSNRRGDILLDRHGTVEIPSIPAASERTITIQYPIPFEQLLLPGTIVGDLNTVVGYALQFPNVANPFVNEDTYDIDIFCQKQQLDLALDFVTNDLTYGEDGTLSYTLQVSNNSNETAYNLSTIYAYEFRTFGQVVDVEVPDDTWFFGEETADVFTVPLYWFIPSLNAGESRTIRVTYRIAPENTSEEFAFSTIVTSPHLEDTNPDNNQIDVLFTRRNTLNDGIDLELSLFTDSPDIGQWKSGTFSFILENKGSVDATGVAVALELDANEAVQVGGSVPVLSSGAYDNGLWSNISIPAGGSARLEVQLFSRVPNLQFTAEVVAANEDDIDSVPNNNNPSEDDFVQFIAATALPDLVLQNVDSPLRFIRGEVSRFMLDIANVGSAGVRGDFEITFTLSEDENLSADDTAIGEIITGNLGLGNFPTTAAVNIPVGTQLGNRFLIAFVDVNEQIQEQDEQNNVLVLPVEITSAGQGLMPTPARQKVQLAPNPASESLQVFSSYDATTDYQIFDMYGRLIKTDKLGDGTITIQQLAAGTYYLKLLAQEGELLRFVKVK